MGNCCGGSSTKDDSSDHDVYYSTRYVRQGYIENSRHQHQTAHSAPTHDTAADWSHTYTYNSSNRGYITPYHTNPQTYYRGEGYGRAAADYGVTAATPAPPYRQPTAVQVATVSQQATGNTTHNQARIPTGRTLTSAQPKRAKTVVNKVRSPPGTPNIHGIRSSSVPQCSTIATQRCVPCETKKASQGDALSDCELVIQTCKLLEHCLCVCMDISETSAQGMGESSQVYILNTTQEPIIYIFAYNTLP